MKIAELEKRFREAGVDFRWNDLRTGRGTPIEDLRPSFRDAVAKVAGEALSNIENARTAPSTATLFDFVCSENDDPRRYRVRVHIDIEPMEEGT